MSSLFEPQVGGVISADIAVPEHEREVAFYSRVLSTGESPLWREADLMNNLGMPVIGLGAMSEEYADLPLQWMPHIQVANVGASVERASRLGGEVLMHSLDEEQRSLWAVLRDPDGAAFGLIPLVPDAQVEGIGADATPDAAGSVGRIGWLDLTVPDAVATRDFYREVVEWSVQEVGMRDGDARYADYNMLGARGTPVAGICHARGVNADLPNVWLIYLPVGDLAASLDRVSEEGGEILKVTRGGDGGYAHAVIRDPVGACLALAQA